MNQKRISIIGAGIAGSTLGRALLKHGIRATIYDRKTASSRHAYAITLHASSYEQLTAILGIGEAEFRSRLSVNRHGKVDASKVIDQRNASPTDLKLHRGKLEDLLRDGLDIKWECAIDIVEWSKEGGTIAHMNNGDKLSNSLLIGADGPHSKVRGGMLPHVKPTVLPYVAFNGKRRIDNATFSKKYAPYFGDSTVLETRYQNTLLSLTIFDKTDENWSISWIYSRPARNSDPLHNPERPLSGAKETPKQFFDEVETLSNLQDPFKDVFDVKKLRKERILHWLMRTVAIETNDLLSMADKDVILIGDAAHAEPILGGDGANNAIDDAIQLAEVLAKSDSAGNPGQYLKSRQKEWVEGIMESKLRIARMHGIKEVNL